MNSKPKTIESLTGQVFGRWTVLDQMETGEKGERKWKCRCACGTERFVRERSLVHGGSLSCGCLRKERAREAVSPDLSGKIFGDLTVLRRLEQDRPGAQMWLCRCMCGADYVVQGTLLVTGRRTHCPGNAHEKGYAYVDITGQKFGRMEALYPVDRRDKNGSVIWHCRCDCGRETEVSYNALRYANQKSCGCQKEEHNQKLQTLLTHVAGTSVDILKSKKVPKDNTTGYRGVYLVRGKYMAKIVFQKKQYFLGTYERIEDAAAARKEAEEVLFDGVAEHYMKWKQIAETDPVWAEANPVEVQVNQADGRLSVELKPEI